MGMAGPGRHRAPKEGDVTRDLGRVYYAPSGWRDRPHQWLSLAGKALMVAAILGVSGAVIMHYVWVGPALPAQKDTNQGPLVPGPGDPTGGVIQGGDTPTPAYTPDPAPLPSLTPPTCTGGSGGLGLSVRGVLPMAYVDLGVVIGGGEQPSRQARQEMENSTSSVHITSTSDEQPVCPMPTAHPLRRTPTHTPSTKRTPHPTTGRAAGDGTGSGRSTVATPSPCPLQLKAGQPLAPTPERTSGAIVPGLVNAATGGGGP